MARLKDIAVSTKDLYMIDPRKLIEKEGWNARIEGPELDAHIRQLADSIKENGVKEPLTIIVENDQLIITNGYCRRRATMLAISEGAEIVAVPVRVEEKNSNEADHVLSMITRNSGKPLTMLEQASVVKRLFAFGWSEGDICKKTGFSLSHVKNLEVLSGASPVVHDMVREGKVSATQAVKTVKTKGAGATEVLQTAVTNAEASGKKKATAKHVDPAPSPLAQVASIRWKTVGPQIQQAIRDYHYALDKREHGGAAAATALGSIMGVLEMPWQVGVERTNRGE